MATVQIDLRMEFMNRVRFWYNRYARPVIGAVCMLMISFSLHAQLKGTLPPALSLEECIAYALSNQPGIRQAVIDEDITDRNIKTRLADWYPQIGLDYDIQHYLQPPRITTPLALKNSSTTSVFLNQNIFSSDLLLATRTAGDVRLNARQNTQLTKIDMVVGVSKSFYDVLVTRQQLDILDQDILRLRKSVKDALTQYEAGTADKTDYKRATIALNNALATKKQFEELLKGKLALLKQQMGYKSNGELTLVYDNQKLQGEILLPPADIPSYQARVEFQQLKTRQRLLQYNLKYTKWSYLPAVSFFSEYNLVAQNNQFSKIYHDGFPNSLVGITFTVPIFQGGKRIQAMKLAQLQLQRLDWDFQSLELAINTEYTTALAVYNASVNDYFVSKDNLSLAQEVYATIQLQYQSGIKTYLDVIIAETDLRTAEVNILDALYEVLSSKLDVQRAAGTINY